MGSWWVIWVILWRLEGPEVDGMDANWWAPHSDLDSVQLQWNRIPHAITKEAIAFFPFSVDHVSQSSRTRLQSSPFAQNLTASVRILLVTRFLIFRKSSFCWISPLSAALHIGEEEEEYSPNNISFSLLYFVCWMLWKELLFVIGKGWMDRAWKLEKIETEKILPSFPCSYHSISLESWNKGTRPS